ncbi:DedA family protein, partial [Klebsiella pneumoniae]|nr:DedA family protein [Klebsiella pneumoniae]
SIALIVSVFYFYRQKRNTVMSK